MQVEEKNKNRVTRKRPLMTAARGRAGSWAALLFCKVAWALIPAGLPWRCWRNKQMARHPRGLRLPGTWGLA